MISTRLSPNMSFLRRIDEFHLFDNEMRITCRPKKIIILVLLVLFVVWITITIIGVVIGMICGTMWVGAGLQGSIFAGGRGFELVLEPFQRSIRDLKFINWHLICRMSLQLWNFCLKKAIYSEHLTAQPRDRQLRAFITSAYYYPKSKRYLISYW